MNHDNVNSPSHYASGKIEVIEAIEDWGLGFHLGNAVKYAARAGKKDPTKECEDLEKAGWYLRRYIELQAAKAEGREPRRPNEMGKEIKKEMISVSGPCAHWVAGAWVNLEYYKCFVPDNQENLPSTGAASILIAGEVSRHEQK